MSYTQIPFDPVRIKIRLWVGVISVSAIILSFTLGIKFGAQMQRQHNSSDVLGAQIAAWTQCDKLLYGYTEPVTPTTPFLQEPQYKKEEKVEAQKVPKSIPGPMPDLLEKVEKM